MAPAIRCIADRHEELSARLGLFSTKEMHLSSLLYKSVCRTLDRLDGSRQCTMIRRLLLGACCSEDLRDSKLVATAQDLLGDQTYRMLTSALQDGEDFRNGVIDAEEWIARCDTMRGGEYGGLSDHALNTIETYLGEHSFESPHTGETRQHPRKLDADGKPLEVQVSAAWCNSTFGYSRS